jgi:hypothetical protein
MRRLEDIKMEGRRVKIADTLEKKLSVKKMERLN